MKDRDLIAQMAASIYPHVNDYSFTKSKEYLAVDVAVSILTEVDARISLAKAKKSQKSAEQAVI